MNWNSWWPKWARWSFFASVVLTLLATPAFASGGGSSGGGDPLFTNDAVVAGMLLVILGAIFWSSSDANRFRLMRGQSMIW